ncbi:MAG TPA: DinB family protein [Bryobacteraceae bacterium]|nr:DinB family protein [Bryobacteraceae bacterium]
MKLNAIAIALCLSGAAWAQTGPSAANEAKQAYNRTKSVLTRAAEKIPEADYSFKATPDVRTIGALIGHVADAQARMCAGLTGSQPPASASSKTAKADLVAVLQESFSLCDKAVDSLTEANALEAVGSGRMQRTRIGAIYGMIIHSNEEYGYLAVYLRLKGIVPPSSEGR